MHLVLDAGNSSIKIAVFENNKLIKKSTVNYELKAIQNELSAYKIYKIKKVGFCSVVDFDLETILLQNWSNCIQINNNSLFPFQINYKTPHTIGIDRLVACSGARSIKKDGSLLVIDMGTCITYDFINERNIHLGGAISPGIKSRAKALHNYTAKLPLVEIKKEDLNIEATSTNNALISGILKGTLFELIGFINEKKTTTKNLTVFLTGGDAFFFEDALKNDIFAEKSLNLIGLNELLKINA